MIIIELIMSARYISITKSEREGKKMKVVFYDADKKKLKTIHFGATGYEDYTMHKDDERKKRYLERHSKEDWNNPMTAGSLSYHILWSEKSLNSAISKFMKKFGLSKK